MFTQSLTILQKLLVQPKFDDNLFWIVKHVQQKLSRTKE